MYFDREINKVKKNIHVSRAISKLTFGTKDFEEILKMFSNKYTEHDVKEACKELYNYNRNIPDIKNLVAAYTVKSYKKRLNLN